MGNNMTNDGTGNGNGLARKYAQKNVLPGKNWETTRGKYFIEVATEQDPAKGLILTHVSINGGIIYEHKKNYSDIIQADKTAIKTYLDVVAEEMALQHEKAVKEVETGEFIEIAKKVKAEKKKKSNLEIKVEMDWDSFTRDVEGYGSVIYKNFKGAEEDFKPESELKEFIEEDSKKGYFILTGIHNGNNKIISEFRKVGGIEEFLEEELDYDPRVKINLANYDMERFHKSTFEKLKSKYGLVEDESDLSGTAIDSFADFSGRETQIDSPVYVPRAPIVEDDEDTQPDYVAEQKKKTIAKLRELTKDISPEHDNSVIPDFEIEDDLPTDYISVDEDN